MVSNWFIAPALARLRSQVNATFPTRGTRSDGTIGDAAHARTESDHNPDPKTGVVRAIDLTATVAQGKKICASVQGDPRTAYWIFNRQIWTPGAGIQPYRGDNPHTNHVHVSLRHNKALENDTTDWKGLDMAKMVSPVEGWVSSEFGNRNGTIHAGADIASHNNKSQAVYASYAGTLSHIVRGRSRFQPATQGPVVAPGRSGNGGRVNNPDREVQAYIHVTLDPKWKNGMKVKRGDYLGMTDLSGNTTGYHLHFEIWNNASPSSYRNPRNDFNYHGVVPGSKPVVVVAPKPKPKPAPKPKPSSKSDPRVVAFQKNLIAMGYPVGPAGADGINGNLTQAATEAYQIDLNKYAGAGLFVDGDWGDVLQNWFVWVKQLQTALPAWRGVPKLVVDGGYQIRTANAVRTVQRNNGLVVDGKAQAKTCAFMRKHGSNVPNPPKNRP